MNKSKKPKEVKAAEEYAKVHFQRDLRPISINSFLAGVQWMIREQKRV